MYVKNNLEIIHVVYCVKGYQAVLPNKTLYKRIQGLSSAFIFWKCTPHSIKVIQYTKYNIMSIGSNTYLLFFSTIRFSYSSTLQTYSGGRKVVDVSSTISAGPLSLKPVKTLFLS